MAPHTVEVWYSGEGKWAVIIWDYYGLRCSTGKTKTVYRLFNQQTVLVFSGKALSGDTVMQNQKILVNPSEQLSSSFNIQSGSYYITYNFTREMAGTLVNPLVIKEISPSRKELKLVPLNTFSNSYYWGIFVLFSYKR